MPLSNPNAGAKTRALYEYLISSFGRVMLTGQMESTWMGSPDYEMDYIEKTTGKLPAIRGLDFMNNDFDGVVERAKAWDKKGGIVTICWHTGINSSGYRESLDDNPDFDSLFDSSSEEHRAMMKSWDRCVEALKRLKDADVPVLWRPFHEFDGQWFWWGKGGADNFVKLWRLMFDKFTAEWGLDNLIWVLGYCGEVKDGWYPGDGTCDLVGSDTYDNSTHLAGWNRCRKVTDKPLCFHECGNVPPLEKFIEDGDLWLFFMVWHTMHIKANGPENLKAVYCHERAVTLDKLPRF